MSARTLYEKIWDAHEVERREDGPVARRDLLVHGREKAQEPRASILASGHSAVWIEARGRRAKLAHCSVSLHSLGDRAAERW